MRKPLTSGNWLSFHPEHERTSARATSARSSSQSTTPSTTSQWRSTSPAVDRSSKSSRPARIGARVPRRRPRRFRNLISPSCLADFTRRAASANLGSFYRKMEPRAHFIVVVETSPIIPAETGAFYHKTGPSMAGAEALAAEVATEAVEAAGEVDERPQALMASRATTMQAGVPVGCAPGRSTWLQRGTGRRSRPAVRRRSRRGTCGGRRRRGRARARPFASPPPRPGAHTRRPPAGRLLPGYRFEGNARHGRARCSFTIK